jgi:hypothetical protein
VVCGVCHPPADTRLAQPVAQGVLAECEAIVARGLATFLEVGQALLRIRDERLYCKTHDTFDAYCQERWGWTRQHANRTIAAAETAGALEPVGSIPPSERAARELAPLRAEPDAMREAWDETVEQHGPTPTAAQVRATVNGHRPKRAARSSRGDSPGQSPETLALAILGPVPRILWWQPLEPSARSGAETTVANWTQRADDLSDLDMEHAERHLAATRPTDSLPPRCRCPRPLGDGEGGCVHCGRGLPA